MYISWFPGTLCNPRGSIHLVLLHFAVGIRFCWNALPASKHYGSNSQKHFIQVVWWAISIRSQINEQAWKNGDDGKSGEGIFFDLLRENQQVG